MVSGTTKRVSDRRVDLQSLDRRQHRDRRRDRAVAVEQGRADQPDDEQQRLPRAGLRVPGAEQRQHGDDAALAAVVGPQDQHRVFQRHDQDQRPKDQRYAPIAADCVVAPPAMAAFTASLKA